jgi:hypothetical protein
MEFREGQTATNPKTGQKLKYEGGFWVAVPGTAPAKPARLSAQEQSELQTARAAAQSRAAAAKDAERFLELNRRAGTGQVWGLPLASEIRGAFDSDFAGMQSLTNRMAPAQREAGSGAMSDKDVALFKRSVPNPDFTGPTNTGIARRMQEDAKRAADYAAFLDEFAATRGTLVGAQAAWQARKARPAAPAAPPRKPAPAQPAAPSKSYRILSVE